MIASIAGKKERVVIGMMSGTSVDGVDAALVRIRGDKAPKAELLAFRNTPFPPAVREKIFALFDPQKATVERVGYMNFLLGELYANAALAIAAQAGMTMADIDAIGSHGQTIWHAPEIQSPDGIPIRYTVQIGEGAVIAARTGVVTVSDFRVADVAAGGQGAPLVPFTEYMLYRRERETILLQNIGGIGNITVLPAGAAPRDVFAFDTGPGNMLIDAVVFAVTQGEKAYDAGGAMAAQGKVCAELLSILQSDPYYAQRPPKSTGRERFGVQYAADILAWQRGHGLPDSDLIATVTCLTAWSIADAYTRFILPIYQAGELIVGGGGSYNLTLLAMLRERFAAHGVRVLTQEALGLNSDAKEAVAFALLADCCVRGAVNTLPGVTGARSAAVMGKISLPPK